MNLKALIGAGLALALQAGGSFAHSRPPEAGFQLGLGLPASDLARTAHNRAGFLAGGFVLVDLGEGHALRPRLDLADFKGTEAMRGTLSGLGGSGLLERTSRTSMVSVGLDYLHYFRGNPRHGLYVLGGLGFTCNEVKTSGRLTMEGTGAVLNGLRGTSSTLRTAGQLGLGWQVNRTFGLELRHQWHGTTSGWGNWALDGGGKRVFVANTSEKLRFTALAATLKF